MADARIICMLNFEYELDTDLNHVLQVFVNKRLIIVKKELMTVAET